MDRVPPGPNSGSRFFISLSDQPHLDGDYTVFARLTAGLGVARRIGAAATRLTEGQPRPIEDIVIEAVTIRKKREAAQGAKESKR
jgi:cyclophilin family peptidyl-prolyl cis-trans isomerase